MTEYAIEINTDMLFLDADSIRGEIRSLTRNVNELRMTAELMGGVWEGEAKEAFMSEFRREVSELEDAVKAAERFVSQTEDCGTEYERCERAVADVVRNIRI